MENDDEMVNDAKSIEEFNVGAKITSTPKIYARPVEPTSNASCTEKEMFRCRQLLHDIEEEMLAIQKVIIFI